MGCFSRTPTQRGARFRFVLHRETFEEGGSAEGGIDRQDMDAFNLDLLQFIQDQFLNDTEPDPYELSGAVEAPLEEALGRTPFGKTFSEVGSATIRAIHGIPSLYARTGFGRFVFYVGRCGATPGHIFSRFSHHRGSKYHTGGVVVARCRTDRVIAYESCAIRIVRGLDARARLCVANVSLHGGGSLPRTPHSCVYLTWGIMDTTVRVTPATRRDVLSIAAEVAPSMGGEISRRVIETAMDPIASPQRQRAPVEWAPGHDPALYRRSA